MNIPETAYVAGLFDGEGCVSANRNNNLGLRSLFLRITITNSNREVLEWIQLRWGGTIGTYNHKPGQWKQMYQWSVSNRDGLAFLTAILPYLRIKKAQAEVALGWPVHDRSISGALLMEKITEEIRRLNTRGAA